MFILEKVLKEEARAREPESQTTRVGEPEAEAVPSSTTASGRALGMIRKNASNDREENLWDAMGEIDRSNDRTLGNISFLTKLADTGKNRSGSPTCRERYLRSALARKLMQGGHER
ncbi:hypothetical protein V1477_019325 [Vespula maculifrons]|uniref:Uncharacterized protein n=2 Tax=Vespula TaxID=7451 RepID=A0A834J4D1_VESVU|nr:hypothetical protein HZH66_014574 [Vespula vulgaris]